MEKAFELNVLSGAAGRLYLHSPGGAGAPAGKPAQVHRQGNGLCALVSERSRLTAGGDSGQGSSCFSQLSFPGSGRHVTTSEGPNSISCPRFHLLWSPTSYSHAWEGSSLLKLLAVSQLRLFEKIINLP